MYKLKINLKPIDYDKYNIKPRFRFELACPFCEGNGCDNCMEQSILSDLMLKYHINPTIYKENHWKTHRNRLTEKEIKWAIKMFDKLKEEQLSVQP